MAGDGVRLVAGRPRRPRGPLALSLLAIALALLAVAPYFAAGVSRSFIGLDDPDYVLENQQVLAGLTPAGVRWALTSFHAANWHPLTWLSHMTDVSLFGLDARGHHLTSILLHGASTALLFLSLLRLTGARWPSAFAAAVFGVHPLRVESVAWVAERKDVLAGLFFMLVLLAYERYARRGGAGRYLVVALFLALGLMSKPMLVTVPAVLLLVDFWPLGRLRPAAIVDKLPLFALAAASGIATFAAQRAGAAVADVRFVPVATRVANAAVSYASYLGKTLWPSSLAVFYPHRLGAIPGWQIGGATLLLSALSLLAFLQRRRRPALAVGWLWFLAMLLPVAGLIQVGEQSMADRYTYLPSIGLLVGLAWTLPAAQPPGRTAAAVSRIAAVAVLAALLAVSTLQARLWQEGTTLFRHSLAVTSDNWLIASSLGAALYKAGFPQEAEALLRRAIRLNPLHYKGMTVLGDILADSGRAAEALDLYREALRIRPDYPVAQNNLGVTLEERGDLQGAIGHYRQALEADPGYPEALYNLGKNLAAVGNSAEAIACFREILHLRPDYEPARRQLETLLAGSHGAPPRR